MMIQLAICLSLSLKNGPALPLEAASTREARLDLEAMRLAIRARESRDDYQAVGDKDAAGRYRAWGAYQFHKARWREVSEAPFGKASPAQQDAAMRRALALYLRKTKPNWTERQLAVWVLNCHHRGHGRLSESGYTRAVWRLYQSIRDERFAGRLAGTAPVPR